MQLLARLYDLALAETGTQADHRLRYLRRHRRRGGGGVSRLAATCASSPSSPKDRI